MPYEAANYYINFEVQSFPKHPETFEDYDARVTRCHGSLNAYLLHQPMPQFKRPTALRTGT